MAEGRMLKRNISESRRLAALKTDAARLLWTWIIPFLDSEGRFFSTSDMIKGRVVPRLFTFTHRNIPTYIADMARVGLILLYEVDGEKLLQYRKFDVFQKIKKDRESAPLPAPSTPDLLRINSRVDQDELPTTSGLPASNLNEVNLNEVKGNSGVNPDLDKKIPPILSLVEKYCTERKNKISPQKFIDHYTANGWMVGKNKMKNWKAAIRTWEQSNYQNTNVQQPIISNLSDPFTTCPSCKREVLVTDLTEFACLKCERPAAGVEALKKINEMLEIKIIGEQPDD